MSVPLHIVARRGEPGISDEQLARIGKRLRPANLPPASPATRRLAGVLAAVFSDGPYAHLDGAAIAIGPVDDCAAWATPGTPAPSFASLVFRADADVVEILTDAGGTRTVWFFKSETELLATTSHRVMAAVLRSFQPNQRVLPWMLAAGCLGPRLSWDDRLSCIPAGATLRLDRRSWELTISREEPRWTPSNGPTSSPAEHLTRLETALHESFAQFPLRDDMVLPISGGYDSRAILLYLRRHQARGTRLRAVTWGTREARSNPQTDAWVAIELCRQLGVEHRYEVLSPETLGFAEVFRRFVALGEGTTDRITGYMDGFALWKMLADWGAACVLRGDMGFGYARVSSESDLRLQTQIPGFEAFENLRSLHSLQDIGTAWPDYMSRLPGESLDEWNHRLGHEYRLPTVLAALNQTKTAFVEISNPLLSRTILETSRTLPLPSRIGKRAFKTLVEKLSPAVPFATLPAIASAMDVYRSPEARAMFREMIGDRGRTYLPDDVVDLVMPSLAPSTRTARSSPFARYTALLKRSVVSTLPPWATGLMRGAYNRRIDLAKVALRAAIITEACHLLEEDANLLRHTP